MVAVAANASVFGPSDVDLGHGEVGGYLQGFAREGKIVGGIAVGILKWGEAGSYPDSGIGFDIRELGKKEGLGIRSMKERVYLFGDRFEIHSEPGKGTRLEAWVALQPKSELATR